MFVWSAVRRPGMVVVLNGPSSVGKSSLIAAFADAAPTPWACFDEPMFGRLATRYLAWPATAARSGYGRAIAFSRSRTGPFTALASRTMAKYQLPQVHLAVTSACLALDRGPVDWDNR